MCFFTVDCCYIFNDKQHVVLVGKHAVYNHKPHLVLHPTTCSHCVSWLNVLN